MARPGKHDALELTTGKGLRKLLANLLKGRLDKSSLRLLAGELAWNHTTLRLRLQYPESFTAAEVDQLLAKFKIKLFATLI